MDKKTLGLLGAVAGLAAAGSAHAANAPAVNPTEALQASSYADLLAPVQNAAALLKADDAARAQRRAPKGEIQLADVYIGVPHHRHHHHHHHHHHHRHDDG
jgi:hypothetical protein